MGKMHEILAVEGDLEGVYKKILEEAKVLFSKKTEHFMGFVKRLENIVEGLPEQAPEYKELVTTVHEKLDYVGDALTNYIDTVLQKELTNQTAKATLEVDGKVIGTDLPATFLLGLETKLKFIRSVYEEIPTLAPGIEWVADEISGKGVYKCKHPDEKFKTAKTFKHKVLYDATDKHPAQIEKWEEQVPVGKYITEIKCGMLSPAEKSMMLGRIDKLIQSVKKARMKANDIDASDRTIAQGLVAYINKG
jgi:hypothetical protein